MTKRVNPVILTLLISDAIMMTGFGLVEPFFAIFVGQVEGGSIVSAGIASAIFMTVKSLIQLPFSRIVDATDHTRMAPHRHRATAFLWTGIGLIVVVPFLYYMSTHIWHVYLAQAVYGLGAGLAYPTWLKLWELHIDKGRESFEWTLYSTVTSLTVAASAVVGGILVQNLGFEASFLVMGLISLLGGATLIILHNDAQSVVIPIKQ
jgi:MFS family permease